MRNNLIILCVCMILTVLPMRATTPAYQATISEPFSDRPEYVVARSGDMNPFGVTESTPTQRTVARKAPPGTTGDKDGPAFPITDGVGVLCLFALAYAIVKRKKYSIQ